MGALLYRAADQANVDLSESCESRICNRSSRSTLLLYLRLSPHPFNWRVRTTPAVAHTGRSHRSLTPHAP